MEAPSLGGGARRQMSRNNRRLHKDSFSAPLPQPRRAQVPPAPWQDISAIMARLVARLARALAFGADCGKPIRLLSTPERWRGARGARVCVLDSTCWKTQSMLQQQHNLICENEDLAAEIDALVLRQEPRELPTISYRGS